MSRWGVVVLLGALTLAGCRSEAAGPITVPRLTTGAAVQLVRGAVTVPPSWSRDGRAVAYADGEGVWVRPLSGPPVRVIQTATAAQVDWSAGTRLIAFVTSGRLWVVEPQAGGRGRAIRLRTPEGAVPAVFRLAWAPAGDRLAAAVRLSAGPDEVYVVGADGGFRRRIYRTPGDLQVESLGWFPDALFVLIGLSARQASDAGAPSRGPTGEHDVVSLLRWRIAYLDRRALAQPFPAIGLPALSPDGTALAFSAVAPPSYEGEELWVMRLRGGDLRHPGAGQGRIASIDWAPGSDGLAVARVDDDGAIEVWITTPDGGAGRRVALLRPAGGAGDAPVAVRWAPDGRHLAVAVIGSAGTPTGGLWVIPLGESQAEQAR